ncbi:protocadherin beta-16-like [Neolamprologus brichardi]|uniref:protocadherin beta-16-like n=1 Tax=Neolamprologus brichardi TaxID=32507 RepID=UPI001643E934|nr:protocadherin beta-16-like [Neolamprologus brichardi]
MKRQVPFFVSFLFVSSVLGHVSYSINEEMSVGSVIGRIAQDLGLDVEKLRSRKARVFFGDSREYIELNKDRGVLLIKERIDRETLCGQMIPCALQFQIILEKPIEFYRVHVEIVDINDNAPLFEKGDFKFKISESAVIGSKFDLERAVDLDVGINGLQNYILKPTDNFALKLHNQADGSRNVEMVLKQPLDREKNEHLSLVLTAVDGGEPQLSGTMQIQITVLDANDNAPVFTKSVYKANVAENSPRGTVVTIVSASDADYGSNGRITYSIGNTLDDVRQLFEVNEHTGEVRLTGNIDYEKSNNYRINVRASDDGGLTDTCKVIVDVIDVNDNHPIINIMSETNVISEDIKSNTVVTIINIQDIDDRTMQRIQSEKSILDEPDSPLERIRRVKRRERTPSIEREDRRFEISESAVVGSKFMLEKAIDPDIGLNGHQSYTLKPNDNFILKMNSQSDGGKKVEMILQKSLDREKQEYASLLLTAVDGGEPQRSGTMQIHITVLDVNDNAPVFTQTVYKAEIKENSVNGTVITKVSASDADKGSNGEVSYVIGNSMRGLSNVFVIMEDGHLVLNAPVDYEKAQKYEIYVEAVDRGGLSDSSKVIIDSDAVDQDVSVRR